MTLIVRKDGKKMASMVSGENHLQAVQHSRGAVLGLRRTGEYTFYVFSPLFGIYTHHTLDSVVCQ